MLLLPLSPDMDVEEVMERMVRILPVGEPD